MPRDLLNPSASEEARKHKLKRLVQSPIAFSWTLSAPAASTSPPYSVTPRPLSFCGSCSMMLCQPTGGRARLTEGCSFQKK
ncbi:unnamed protein product, partial [Heterosigma akashiwo]